MIYSKYCICVYSFRYPFYKYKIEYWLCVIYLLYVSVERELFASQMATLIIYGNPG